MSCTSSRTLQGLPFECSPARPGVEKIYLAQYGDAMPVVDTDLTSDSAMTVTSISSGITWYGYELPKNTASLESPMTVADDGRVTYANTISMQFNRLEAKKHAELAAIAQGYVMALVVDKAGRVWFVGYDEYLAPTDGNAMTGASASDRNGYDLTLVAESAYLPFEVPASVFEGITKVEPSV